LILTAETVDGATLALDCPEHLAAAWTSRAILEGRTYPEVPFVGEVRTIVDAGANIGAATIFFAHHHPDARVHAVEPGAEARAFLERNVAGLPNVTVHPVALAEADATTRLFHVEGDIGQASLVDSAESIGSEEVVVRAAGAWAAEQGIDRIDILKVDVEGYEVAVLESLGPLVAGAKVIHVEYDDRKARRRIEAMLATTHELYIGTVLLDQGEVTYVRTDLLADTVLAQQSLIAILAARVRASTTEPPGQPADQ
jgi:FkbM family methyltransferase